MKLQSVWDKVDGHWMHAVTGADPPPEAPVVILMHGLVVSHRYMRPLARHLGDHYRVFAPDLPGIGFSERPARAPSMEEQAAFLVAWMDARGIKRAHLIGNSMGCQIATMVAVTEPARVGRLVLQGPTVDPQAPGFPRQFARWCLAGLRDPKKPLMLVLGDYARTGPRLTTGYMRAMLDDRIEARLPEVQAPTLVVRGSRDPIVPQRWAEEVVRLLPHGRLKLIPGAAHIINHSSPLELERVVLPFLGQAAT